MRIETINLFFFSIKLGHVSAMEAMDEDKGVSVDEYSEDNQKMFQARN